MYTSDIFGSFTRIAAAALLVTGTVSCITDEGIPYPDIQANFAEFTVQNQERTTAIDTVNRRLTVYLDEAADIHAVRVLSYKLTPEGSETVIPGVFDSPIDLSDTMFVSLKVYREYLWSITARQTIERYFSLEGQIGASEINPENHTVSAVVSSEVELDAVHVLKIKLGGSTAVMNPDLNESTVDFSSPVAVKVSEFDKETTWTISITRTEAPVTISSVTAWTGVIWANADAQEGSDISFEYRPSGTMQWLKVNSSDITVNGAVFTACINGVQPETEYEVRAMSGDFYTISHSVTTGEAVQLPDNHFTQWWKDGSVWNPWTEGGTQFWDTGNRGAATLGQSNVVPTVSEDGTYQGVTLQTKFVGIGILGKLAAGSIFAGQYVRTDGTNGVLAFGRPFTQRPTRVKARIRYKTSEIDKTSTEMAALKGQPDTCVVWCALWDGTEPFEIRTNPKNRQLFNPEDPNVIAYGDFNSGNDITDWTDIIIPLKYNSIDRIPTMILLVSSSSKYGDYFTGGTESVMWLDSYELLYDY